MKTYAIVTIFLLVSGSWLYGANLEQIDVIATTGYTTFPDENWIDHWIAGGSARIYLTRRLAVETEFLYMRGPDSDRDYTLVPSVVYVLSSPEKRTQPYLIGGAGIFWHRETIGTSDFTVSDWTVSGGAGIRQYLNDRFFLQGDARLGYEALFRASFSVGYSFGN